VSLGVLRLEFQVLLQVAEAKRRLAWRVAGYQLPVMATHLYPMQQLVTSNLRRFAISILIATHRNSQIFISWQRKT